MVKLIGKKIFTILCLKILFIYGVGPYWNNLIDTLQMTEHLKTSFCTSALKVKQMGLGK